MRIAFLAASFSSTSCSKSFIRPTTSPMPNARGWPSRPLGFVELALAPRHDGDELVVTDLHEDVARRDLHGVAVHALGLHADDLAQCLLLHASEEGLDDAELHVGLEQREADLAESRLEVLLGQLRGQRGDFGRL
jgi:hypothetical protein